MPLQRLSTGKLLKTTGGLAKECCCEDPPYSDVGCGNCVPGFPCFYNITFEYLKYDFERFNGLHVLTNYKCLELGCASWKVDGYECCLWEKVFAGEGSCESEIVDWRIRLIGSRLITSPYDYRWQVSINYGGALCTHRWRVTGLDRTGFCLGPSGSIPFYDCEDTGCPHRRVDASIPPSAGCRCNDLELGGLEKCNCAQINGGATCVIS